MGNKRVVLALAMCLVISSFHEISCQQVGGSREFGTLEGQESESNVQTFEGKATSSVSHSLEAEYEAAGSYEAGRSSSSLDDTKRGFNKNAGSEAELMDASETGGSYQEQVKELQQRHREGGERTGDGSDINQNYLSEQNRGFMIKEPTITRNEAGSMGSHQHYETKQESTEDRLEYHESRTSSSGSSSGSGIRGSLPTGQSGRWRCINQDNNGGKGDDSIEIPNYEFNDIIKEESIEGYSSKTSSLITSLTEMVDKHKKRQWTDVKTGKVSTTVTSEKIKQLKMTLKKYVGLNVSELVNHSDYEKILTMASQYEELTAAKETYIWRLATYGTVIKESVKTSRRVETVQQRVTFYQNMVSERQKRVDSELELVKELAQKGDNLAVQIFAMKKAVSKLEARKKKLEIQFQMSVENLSSVLEESTHAYEQHRVVVREWKEVQASETYSRETVQTAHGLWVQFLKTIT
ncbi:NAI2-like protein [Raphanus sativus]|nr:NAI2-like protein [Raphanus sativus]